MKKRFLLCICCLFLASCNIGTGMSTIDWVDFIKFNGRQYEGIYSGVAADPKMAGGEIGQVQFMVVDNISNPHYRPKNGDAAFWEKGTKIFSVKGEPDMIAVQDEHEIHGYRLYYANTDEYQWHYKHVDKDELNKIDIYNEDSRLLHTFSDQQTIKAFINLLDSGETTPSFSPNTASGDPAMYQMIFYTDQTAAYKFPLFFDGDVWFWHPWDTSILPDGMEKWIMNGTTPQN
ncbi:hypothetical protein BTO30_10955 [Domibacillus antri]|uniref:DUF3298 domain-containing protein n=1 Tax=Domibacillus antri TaxID=1714264 RepID=A0A1Q8Q4J6_9BACI|nr:hypothetical protein [Domibacillus antri]OLN22259.1 hypothetical protein BTO30_10955 [Domibacillus antri]